MAIQVHLKEESLCFWKGVGLKKLSAYEGFLKAILQKMMEHCSKGAKKHLKLTAEYGSIVRVVLILQPQMMKDERVLKKS